jgi:hypothetical protein
MEQVLGSSSADKLPVPVQGGRGLTTQDRQSIDLSDSIPGWGSDLDPAMRPGVPRDKAPELGNELLYPEGIPQQEATVRIHKSTEHARLTPVFGTSCPPKGLSGKMRDAAYKYSEGKFAHWLMLMAADRVDVVEDVASDLAHMRVPNLVKEMGLKSEWEYNRHGFITKVAVGTIAVAALMVLMRGRSRSD